MVFVMYCREHHLLFLHALSVVFLLWCSLQAMWWGWSRDVHGAHSLSLVEFTCLTHISIHLHFWASKSYCLIIFFPSRFLQRWLDLNYRHRRHHESLANLQNEDLVQNHHLQLVRKTRKHVLSLHHFWSSRGQYVDASYERVRTENHIYIHYWGFHK